MIVKRTFVGNLCVASKVAGLPGAIVECGVWRGGMSAAISDVLGPDREYFLFDSFEGMPPVKDIDGPAAREFELKGCPETNNATASEAEARSAMRLSKASKVKFVKGWFEHTVPGYNTGPIALLRLDGDWYDSTMIPLKQFYPHLVSGGIIIIDDYLSFDGCSRAVHDFIQTVPEPLRIQEYANSVFFVIKP